MKFTIILSIVFSISLFASNVLSQNSVVNIAKEETSLQKALDEIEQQTNYRFLYHSEIVRGKVVTLDTRNKTLLEIMDQIKEKANVEYDVFEDNLIVLRPKVIIQPRILKGEITDEEGYPIIGVTVLVKGTRTGTITDINGEYEFQIPYHAKVLNFSYIGMLTREIEIGDKAIINVTLQPDIIGLDEIVVLGYGIQKKSDLTGSVVRLTNKQMEPARANSFLEAVQGKMTGVSILKTSGEPGSASKIRIRGTNTIYGSSNPLFVIDGMPVELHEEEVASTSLGTPTPYDPLASINPSDIESIDVLKDASASAIFGSRGANGVIIITTKSGEKGRNRIVYDGNFGVSTISKKMEVLNAREFIEYQELIHPNSILFWDDTDRDGTYGSLGDDPKDPYTLPFHDWQDEMLRTALSQNHNLSATGGFQNTRYSGSIGYANEEGIVKNNDYQRYNVHIKLDNDKSDRFQLGMNFNSSYSDYSGATHKGGGTGIKNGIIQNLLVYRPIEIFIPSWDLEDRFISPMSMLEDAYKNVSLMRSLFNANLDYEIIEGLKLNISGGGLISSSKGKEYYPSNTCWGNLDKGLAIIKEHRSYSWFNTNQITYNKTFGTQSLSLIGAFEINQYNFESFFILNSGFEDETTGVNDISKGSVIQSVGSSRTGSNRLSYLTRLNYSIMERFLITATFRADGSDKFGTGNRFGYFPSVALAWKIHQESFLKNNEQLNLLKIRISYGITGNDRISSHQYMASMENTYYNGQLGLTPASFANPELKWESTTQYNAGIDIGILNNRIVATVDVYLKETYNMLIPAFVSSQTGYNQQWQNIGQVMNKGFEILLTTHTISRSDFKWLTDFNASYNRNKVVELGEVGFIPVEVPGGFIQNIGRVAEGYPIGTAFGYEFDGIYQIDDFIWQNNNDPGIAHEDREYTLKDGMVSVKGIYVKPGSFKFIDRNKDGTVDDEDRTFISNIHPLHYGGVNNTLNYKGLELSVFFEWAYGNEIYNESRFRLEGPFPHTYMNLSRDFWYNRWTPDNPTNEYGAIENTTSQFVSSYYVENASWIRLKNVTLSYQLPSRIVNRLGSREVRVYLMGINLLTWTKYSNFDPEIHSGYNLMPGVDHISYPQSRTIKIGFNATF